MFKLLAFIAFIAVVIFGFEDAENSKIKTGSATPETQATPTKVTFPAEEFIVMRTVGKLPGSL